MRKGLTILELLVVIAIIAVLLAILAPAIQRVRAAAMLAASTNNIRQMTLGLQNLVDTHNGNLPGFVASSATYRDDPLVELLPYVGASNTYKRYASVPPGRLYAFSMRMQIPSYVNPLDPTYGLQNPEFAPMLKLNPSRLSVSCYALNAQFFGFYPQLSGITDGLSQTIWITEHYAWNCNGTSFLYTFSSANRWQPLQPATFAQAVSAGRPQPGDYCPITTGNPPQSSSLGNTLFQTAPKVSECDPRLPNAGSSQGLQAGLADGSVRIFAPSVSPQVFWGAVTPNKGEIISLD